MGDAQKRDFLLRTLAAQLVNGFDVTSFRTTAEWMEKGVATFWSSTTKWKNSQNNVASMIVTAMQLKPEVLLPRFYQICVAANLVETLALIQEPYLQYFITQQPSDAMDIDQPPSVALFTNPF
jgi:hypothetical protein